MREIADDETSLARAQGVQMLEHGLAIVERAERIRHQDDVEGPGQFSHERAILDIADQECEMRMGLARLLDHGRTEIDANPISRLERGEKLSGAASELEYAGALPDQEFDIEQVLGVKEVGARKPFAAFRRARIG